MPDTLRYETALSRLRIENSQVRQKFDAALNEFDRATKHSSGAIAYVLNQLYARQERSIDEPMLGISIPMRELDFGPGHPVYSITPRLLLKVPDKWREGSDKKPIVHREEGPRQNKPIVGWEGTPLPEDAVITYPNQEGDQENVEDRPVVQWSGVRSREMVIIGRIDMTQRKQIASIITNVIGEPPADKSVWKHYEETATIEDLSEILTNLRKAGFSNQYSPKPDYLLSAKPAIEGTTENSGFFSRDRDKEFCTMVFVRGDIRFGYETQEEMTGGGYATILMAVSGPKGNEFRPVSIAFARENYRYELNDKPVEPPKRSQLRFRRDCELRTHEAAFEQLLDKMAEINKEIRKVYQQEQVPDPQDVALEGGTRGADHPKREHKRG